MSSSRVEGFKEWRNELNRTKKGMDKVGEKVLTDASLILLRVAKKNTRVDTGHLRGSWFVSRSTYANGSISREVYNDAEYALYVNNGHRIVKGKGENKVTVGLVKGDFMLESGIRAAKQAIPQIYDREMRKLVK